MGQRKTSYHLFSAMDKRAVSVVVSPVCAINPLNKDLLKKNYNICTILNI